MDSNHGHDKQRQRLNERELEAAGKGRQLEKWESLTEWFKRDRAADGNGSCTVSAEALGEGGGVGDVISRVLLWHQGNHWAICYLHHKNTNTPQNIQRTTLSHSCRSDLLCARVPDSEPACWVFSSRCRSWLWHLHPAGWFWPSDPDAILWKEGSQDDEITLNHNSRFTQRSCNDYRENLNHQTPPHELVFPTKYLQLWRSK